MEIPGIGKERRKRTNGSPDLSALVYGKVPPQARDLEEAILGAIMLERDAFVTASQFVFADAFYVDSHQRMFAAMLSLYDKGTPIDILTVVEALRKADELDIVGGPYSIVKLTNGVTSSANIEDHCKIVLEKYMKREAIRIGGAFIEDAYEDSTDPFKLYEVADNAIINTQERVLKGETVDMSSFAMKVAEQHSSVKATGVLGIPTHIRALDSTICGLVEPDLIIIAARPGQGKTAFALSITYNTSVEQDIPCAWFSLEMDGIQLTRRLASIDSQVPHELIRTGRTTPFEEKAFYSSLEKLSNSKIYIEDKGSTNIRTIRTKAYILKRKYGIRYIVVDYLQLMEGIETKGKSREQIISEISRGLKMLAKELGIPVIALSQLSREVEKRPNKMPQLSDLRDSGAIEQDADVVIFLMRPEYYDFKEDIEIAGTTYPARGLCVGLIEKNRHGSTKNIPMSFHGPTMNITTHIDDRLFTPVEVVQTQVNNYRPPYKDDSDLPEDTTSLF